MSAARIVAALALVALSACSNGLSKEEFIEQADRICREADEKTRGLTAPRSPEALKGFVAEAQEVTEKLLEDLRELDPPDGDAGVIEEMTARIESAMRVLPDIQAAAEQRDLKEIERLASELKETAAEANDIAREYGFQDCGQADPAAVP